MVTVKPGFHIVVSVVRKKFIGQIQLYGNLPYNCSIQQKREIQLVVRDRMNSICPMNFFRTTDTTDTTIWKPGLRPVELLLSEIFNIQTYFSKNKIDKLVRKLDYLRKKFAPIGCPPPPGQKRN